MPKSRMFMIGRQTCRRQKLLGAALRHRYHIIYDGCPLTNPAVRRGPANLRVRPRPRPSISPTNLLAVRKQANAS